MTIKANTPNEYRPGTAMRAYVADECGKDGYPAEWHETVKHAVREAAGNRCVRCGHPYEKGAGEWSPCDQTCFSNDYHPFGDPHTRTRWEYEGESGEGIEIVEARWRILTVHHLDGNKANCRWWNLVALCQRCHLQIQGKVDMRRVWPWEHSEWFRPYVAGYYAWTYLDEDLTREEVDARLDELLALERADQNPELRPNDQPEAGFATPTSKDEKRP